MTGVRRVQTEYGSHIEPPFDEAWDGLTQLQWEAAVAAFDTGLRVSVSAGGHQVKRRGQWVDAPGSYSVNVGNSSCGSFNFRSAWSFITGVSVGAREAARAAVLT